MLSRMFEFEMKTTQRFIFLNTQNINVTSVSILIDIVTAYGKLSINHTR